MARPELTPKEISRMSYETRRRMFDQEQEELFKNAPGLSTAELHDRHQKLVDKWKV